MISSDIEGGSVELLLPHGEPHFPDVLAGEADRGVGFLSGRGKVPIVTIPTIRFWVSVTTRLPTL
jgi:hypothetical protein